MDPSTRESDLPYRQPPAPAPPPRVRAIDAIVFPFRQEGIWSTSLVALAYLFVPVVGQLAFRGYQAEIFQRLLRRDPTPMPPLRFDDFSRYIKRGVPGVLVEILSIFVPGFLGIPLVVPMAILLSQTSLGQSPVAAFGLLFGPIVLVALGLMPIWQAAYTRAAITEDVGRTFRTRALLRYVRATMAFLPIGLVAYALLAMGVVFGGALACMVGMYPAAVIVQLGMVHLRWQIYEAHVARGGEPIAMMRVEASAMAPHYAFQMQEQAPMYQPEPAARATHHPR